MPKFHQTVLALDRPHEAAGRSRYGSHDNPVILVCLANYRWHVAQVRIGHAATIAVVSDRWEMRLPAAGRFAPAAPPLSSP